MRRLLSLSLTLATWAGAQVVLLPLDSRPATSTLPSEIAALSGQYVSAPSPDLLGDATRGADPEALTRWLAAQSPGTLIISLDALAYGGLVQSRTSELSVEEVLARLQSVRAWYARGEKVYAFITLPREPDAINRARNYEVARRMIEWAREGVFAELHITWDDAKTGSPAPQEGARLRQDAPASVRVYPGADEVLASLAARALAPEGARLSVEYSNASQAARVAQYEGIALTESVRLHAEAAGWSVVPTVEAPILTPFGGRGTRPGATSDLYLYVYNGGDTRAAALRISQLMRSGPVAVADVRSVNLGNFPMWSDLQTLNRPQDMASLAAWGTPGNNIGTALAHAKIYLSEAARESPDFTVRQDALLARQYANDVIFSAKVRAELRRAIPEANLVGPQVSEILTRLAREYFPVRMGRLYLLQEASLPWNRSFEWRFELVPAGQLSD
ncbi:DUF4127 family protein [Deinococcus peraridilitoris]|uniref:DUF4127 family protein n=1 Tax=Deinococcus peraridilitoris (strain DSM 19664 / LMG 22246 / CIP 109416 / KR-200) TaxID=937777 RepID=K9ZYY3_DEIPD|nr:DUF4127 family protein [Deinococcus peraridilitoris]AFZ65970.1 hypothetical protein Deipe_0370 [Deinococcus peraridilitoris DSM 19664]